MHLIFQTIGKEEKLCMFEESTSTRVVNDWHWTEENGPQLRNASSSLYGSGTFYGRQGFKIVGDLMIAWRLHGLLCSTTPFTVRIIGITIAIKESIVSTILNSIRLSTWKYITLPDKSQWASPTLLRSGLWVQQSFRSSLVHALAQCCHE